MRILRERVSTIAQNVVNTLLDQELIEAVEGAKAEVVLDVESVLNEYRRMDYELTEKARDIVATRAMEYSQTFKIKAKLAQDRGFGLYEEAIPWIIHQVVELLLQSHHVEEVYGEDTELRAALIPVLKRELNVDDKLDQEVKKRIKNLQEGTSDYEIEYQKTMEQIRSAQKLDR